VVDGIDQHRNPEHVRQQDELLPARGAFLADAGQEIDRVFPFAEGKVGPANIVVQRLYQFFHQKLDTRVRRLVKAADHGGGEFGVVELGHVAVLRVTPLRTQVYTSDPAMVSVLRLDQDALFGYQGEPASASGDHFRC
jgi:hypothetical protein